jgi:hypothetical protein
MDGWNPSRERITAYASQSGSKLDSCKETKIVIWDLVQ